MEQSNFDKLSLKYRIQNRLVLKVRWKSTIHYEVYITLNTKIFKKIQSSVDYVEQCYNNFALGQIFFEVTCERMVLLALQTFL